MKHAATWIASLFAGIALSVAAFAKPVMMDAASMKFTDMPGFQGIKTVTVEGDAAKGAHHAFTKFAAGFSAPPHFHTANHYVAVISGTLSLNVDGKEHKLPPGSFFSFTEKSVHSTKCEPGADCLLFLDVRGKWDVVPDKKKMSSL